MNPKRRALFLSCCVLLVLAGVPTALTWRAAKRAYATAHLIEAIKELNVSQARAYLAEGADPNVHETDKVPVSFIQVLLNVLFRRPLVKADEENNSDPALLVALQPSLEDEQTVSLDEQQKRTKIACLLMNYGAKIEKEYPLLTGAVEYQLPEVVQKLIEQGADVNQDGVNSYTPLILASSRSNTKIVRLLLGHGANPNIQTRHYGYSALMLAALKGQTANVQTLLQYKADVHTTDEYQETALQYASNLTIRKMICQTGGTYEHTPTAALFRAIRRNDVAAVKDLLNNRLSPDAVDEANPNKPTALIVAVEMGYADSKAYTGTPPRNNRAIIQTLIGGWADVNLKCRDGVTSPLFLARRHSPKALINLLLKAGAKK